DAVIAGFAVTPELRRQFVFSRPYLMLPARFVRNLAVPLDGKTAAALSKHPVGVFRGTVHEAMLAAFFPAIKAEPFEAASAS
ncbi:amino acid ABC transporter, partial [Rhizobium ruizarguesonis]